MAKHPLATTLGQLSSFSALDSDQLEKIAHDVVLKKASKGARLLQQGSTDEATLYLIEGRLQLTAADGTVMYVDHTDPSANDPVARLRPARYEVTAATPVRFLRVDNTLLDRMDRALNIPTIQAYEVNEASTQEELQLEMDVSALIEDDLKNDRLILPSLPETAIRVGQVVNDDNATAQHVAQAIVSDPSIAAKLLKTANSARYAGRAEIKSLDDAVVRLGLNNTHKLVVAFTLRELFRSPNRVLQQYMKNLWEHSRLVAALSHVLAKRTKGFDPDFALLAGLVHDVGEIAILTYSEPLIDDSVPKPALDAVMQRMRGSVGGHILDHWQLAPELALVARHAEDWSRLPAGVGSYIDLIQVAQYHAFIGKAALNDLPPINEIAAFGCIGLDQWNPEASLALLEEARSEIDEVTSTLG